MEDNNGSYKEYILNWEFVVDIQTTSRRYMKCRQDEDLPAGVFKKIIFM